LLGEVAGCAFGTEGGTELPLELGCAIRHGRGY
jgi:hypothetical protein